MPSSQSAPARARGTAISLRRRQLYFRSGGGLHAGGYPESGEQRPAADIQTGASSWARWLRHGCCVWHPVPGQQRDREDGQRVEAVQHADDGCGVGGVGEEELHHDEAERDRRPAHAVLDLGAERDREQGDGEQQDDVGEGVVQGHPGGVAVGDGALVDVVLQGEGAERDQRRLHGDGQGQQVGEHPVCGSHDHASLRCRRRFPGSGGRPAMASGPGPWPGPRGGSKARPGSPR